MLAAQLNLLDSHDVSRFLTLCGGDRARMEQAVLFQMAFPGMPCVFYGDEKGLEGASENEYRRPMDFGRADGLEEAYRRAGDREFTDDAGVMEAAGFPVAIVHNEAENLKLTYAGETELLARLLEVEPRR